MKLTNQLRRMGLDDAQIAATTSHGKPLVEAERPTARAERMNKTEQLFAWELEALKREAKIERWAYEAVKLRLAKRT